jgi:cytochrome c553
MKKVLLLTFILAYVAFAETHQDPHQGPCAGCHGANGEKAALGKSKIIKDMSKTEIIAAMDGYKDGSYGEAMKGLMKGQTASLSAADIEAIANQI